MFYAVTVRSTSSCCCFYLLFSLHTTKRESKIEVFIIIFIHCFLLAFLGLVIKNLNAHVVFTSCGWCHSSAILRPVVFMSLHGWSISRYLCRITLHIISGNVTAMNFSLLNLMPYFCLNCTMSWKTRVLKQYIRLWQGNYLFLLIIEAQINSPE